MTTERPPFSAYRLPPGRHGIPPEEVAENQRWRLLGAAAEVLAEEGYVRTTSSRIAKAAGVSSATFYTHFDNLGACLLAAYEASAECVVEVAATACEEDEARPTRLGESVEATLAFLAAEPAVAKLLAAEAPAGEESITRARGRLLERLARLLAAARPGPGRRGPGRGGAELPVEVHLIGGAHSLLSSRISAGGVESLPELGPELTAILGCG